jgi:hypothetical protein
MAVVASATGAAVFGLSGVAAGLAGGALLGAGAGALYSGLTGDGNILDSALTGALLGGAVGGLGAAFAPAAGGTGLTATAPLTGTGALAPGAATTASTGVPALTAAKGTLGATAASPSAIAAQQAAFGLGATAPVAGAAPVASTFGTFAGAGAPAGLTATQTAAGLGAGAKTAAGMTGGQMLATGLAGTTALSLLGNKKGSGIGQIPDAGYIRPYTYSSTPVPAGDEYPSPYPSTPLYNAQGNPILDTRERNYFDQQFIAGEPYKAANGGLMAAYQAGGPVERMSMMNTAMNPQGGLYPMGMIDKTQYATPTQRPVSSELMMDEPAYNRSNPMLMAKGGQVKGYAPGGQINLQGSFNLDQGNMNSQAFPGAATVGSGMAPMQTGPTTGGPGMSPSTISPMALPFTGMPATGGPGMGPQNHMYQPQLAVMPRQFMAEGGDVQGYNLGGYSDGGRLLRGPGDGVSDDIPAVIGNRQPARLADGEFVIPARIVSELGNGSTDAGAKRLYAMMDRIQNGRKKTIGKKNVAKDTKAKKHLLA